MSTEGGKAQYKGCELSFIWGKMRTVARQAAFQMAQRNCSKAVREKSALCMTLEKGGGGACSQAHTWQWFTASQKSRCHRSRF